MANCPFCFSVKKETNHPNNTSPYQEEEANQDFFFLFLGVYGTGICDTKWAWSGGECADAERRADAAAAAEGRRVRLATGRCVWCAGGAGPCVWCGPAGSAGCRSTGGVRSLDAPLQTPAPAPLASLSP